MLYKLGDWLWAELKGGEGGYIPYSHCRMSKKHYCTPVHLPRKKEAIKVEMQSSSTLAFTQSLIEERAVCEHTGSFLTRTSSPKRAVEQSYSELNELPELSQVREHKSLLGARVRH